MRVGISSVGRAWLVAALAGLVLNANGAVARWGKDYLPNVEVVTQDGNKVRFYDDVLKDKITVISFIYTTCRDICPLITARMAQVYQQLGAAAGRDVHFVSISIDPENDTPEKMKEHAEAFRSDPNWLFLTGEKANVDLVRHKLGERSRKLTEHAAQVMLYNDRTGEWSRDSAFADLGALALAIRSMDPAWQAATGGSGQHAAHLRQSDAKMSADLPGQALFVKACAACHTIGQGDRVGPDLKDVSQRRERSWLLRFVGTPSRLHAEKDPTALALAAAFPKVRMPNLQMSDADVVDLLSYIDARSFAAVAPGGHAGHAEHDHAAGHKHGHSAHEVQTGGAGSHDHAAHAQQSHDHSGHHGSHAHGPSGTNAPAAATR